MNLVTVAILSPLLYSLIQPSTAANFHIPLIDLSTETNRQVVVDREQGQYLGHVTTVLLEDNKTILATYPKGHGKGGIVLKRSVDAGKTWSDRLPVPENWSTSREVPTIHRVIDPSGVKRLILFSGLYPCRMAVSDDDGENWTPLKPVGDWGGIVTMGSVEPLKTGPGHYLALFHDDGRYFKTNGTQTKPITFTLYKTLSHRRRPHLELSRIHLRITTSPSLRTRPHPLVRRSGTRRPPAREFPHQKFPRHLLPR